MKEALQTLLTAASRQGLLKLETEGADLKISIIRQNLVSGRELLVETLQELFREKITVRNIYFRLTGREEKYFDFILTNPDTTNYCVSKNDTISLNLSREELKRLTQASELVNNNNDHKSFIYACRPEEAQENNLCIFYTKYLIHLVIENSSPG